MSRGPSADKEEHARALPSGMEPEDRADPPPGRARHYVRSEPIPRRGVAETPPAGILGRLASLIRKFDLRNLMRDRPPSPYSSLSPRLPDGTHGPIFPFNSEGDGGLGG